MSLAARRFAITWHSNLLRRTSYLPRQCYSTSTPEASSKFELPSDPKEWAKLFKVPLAVNHRISIRNSDLAAKVADAFVPEGSRGKVIIEAYPGPGQLTRALLNLPKDRVRKLIILESWAPYLEWLKPLEAADPRLIVLEKDGFNWASYSEISELGLLDDVAKVDWKSGVHPDLQFISHLPSTIYSEQLVSQLFRAMPEAGWLFQYGRIPLNLVLSDHLYKRIGATLKDTAMRCKLSIVAEATAQCTPSLNFLESQPYEEHFHPIPGIRAMAAEMKKDSRAVGRPFRTMTAIPLENQLIPKGQMDAWDYCLRRLFVKKSTELRKAISTLAPNAQILIKAVTKPELSPSERLDVTKKIKDMDARDWSILLKAFDEWPFKPEDLTIYENYSGSRH
ncbi:hypothetical protein H0H87_005772 [Tephrocybe sp. NHM501043]|nr:hypothetical protein H0H87_005772 [Tephrocybe sp. NHM501043]